MLNPKPDFSENKIGAILVKKKSTFKTKYG